MQKYITGKNQLRVNVPDDTVSCGALCVKADVPAGPTTPFMRFDPPDDGMIAGSDGRLIIQSPAAFPSGAGRSVSMKR